MSAPTSEPGSVDEVAAGLRAAGYLPGESTALVSYLATRLGKPVLVEGPAGVGKTELAKALSRYLGRELVRLQCYEGLDEAKALYEWNYRKQLLRIQASASDTADAFEDIFAEDFLLTRPLMEAIARISGRASRNSSPKMSSWTASQAVPSPSAWMRSSCLR